MSERNSREPVLVVDDDGITVHAALDSGRTYDVLIEGQHVWSLQPARDMRSRRGALVSGWPRALRPYLNGRADVQLRDHATSEILGTTTTRLGDGRDRPILVRDKHGRPLILDKWGRMIVPLETEESDQVAELIDKVKDILDVLRVDCGVPAYIAYGTLLGAVRNGRLIGYDNDLDVAYVASYETPVDIIRESYRIQRTLTEAGWVVRRGSGTRLNVRVPLADGSVRHVDVFTSFWLADTFHTAVDIGTLMAREDVLPLSTVDLVGRKMPAPANPEAMLAAAYGDGWRVPDPAFQYDSPRWLKRRFAGYFGGLITHRKHWDAFNAKHKGLAREPSPFAQWVASEFPSDRLLVDVGCGTTRDTRFFAAAGRPVLGIDYGLGTLTRGRRWATRKRLDARFEPLNLYDTRAALAMGARLSREDHPLDLYARFVLHALEDRGRVNFWRLSTMALRGGGRLFVEFRTTEDARRDHHFGNHFRRFLDPAEVVAEIEARGGRVVHQDAGTGLAPFRTEDPHVCRLVATWSD